MPLDPQNAGFLEKYHLPRSRRKLGGCLLQPDASHKGLRLRNVDESQSKWKPRTPAMVAELTDHIWSVKELLLLVPLPLAYDTN